MAFDPDAYLAKKTSGFDPDAYLASKASATQQPQWSDLPGNIPESAVNVAGGLWQAVRHPVDTANALGSTVAGVVQNARDYARENLPENMKGMVWDSDAGMGGEDYRPTADAVAAFYKDRYGSLENAKQTMINDPVGFLVDASAVLSPFSPKAGAAINPINAAVNTGKVIAGKVIPKSLPKSMYESVAKFGTTVPEKQRSAMVETALKNEIIPTSKGVAKLEGLIGDLNAQIDTLISSATAAGETIPARAVYKYLKALRQKKGGMSLDAPDDLHDINRVIAKFEQHLKQKGKSRLTPAELQELKINAYKSINWDAKRMMGTPIKEDTYKAVARGAKEGVEQMVPDVKGVNQQLGELYELQPHLQRAANRIENKNLISINDAPQVMAGGVLGGPVGAALGTLVSILGKDRIKAVNAVRLQKLINDANFQQFLNNNPNISQAELMAILSGRQAIESGSQ